MGGGVRNKNKRCSQTVTHPPQILPTTTSSINAGEGPWSSVGLLAWRPVPPASALPKVSHLINTGTYPPPAPLATLLVHTWCFAWVMSCGAQARCRGRWCVGARVRGGEGRRDSGGKEGTRWEGADHVGDGGSNKGCLAGRWFLSSSASSSSSSLSFKLSHVCPLSRIYRYNVAPFKAR